MIDYKKIVSCLNIEERAACCLENIRIILEAGGSNLQPVPKLNVFLWVFPGKSPQREILLCVLIALFQIVVIKRPGRGNSGST